MRFAESFEFRGSRPPLPPPVTSAHQPVNVVSILDISNGSNEVGSKGVGRGSEWETRETRRHSAVTVPQKERDVFRLPENRLALKFPE